MKNNTEQELIAIEYMILTIPKTYRHSYVAKSKIHKNNQKNFKLLNFVKTETIENATEISSRLSCELLDNKGAHGGFYIYRTNEFNVSFSKNADNNTTIFIEIIYIPDWVKLSTQKKQLTFQLVIEEKVEIMNETI